MTADVAVIIGIIGIIAPLRHRHIIAITAIIAIIGPPSWLPFPPATLSLPIADYGDGAAIWDIMVAA